MPKDASGKREPRLRRHLPQSFLDGLQGKRDAGEPHLFTEKELDAIVSYVSRRPTFHPLGTRLQLPPIEEYRNEEASIRQRRIEERDTEAKSLIERIQGNSLKKRITAIHPAVVATAATPIAPKPTLLNFNQISDTDRIGILRPRLEATIKRLDIVVKLLDKIPTSFQTAKSIRDYYSNLQKILDPFILPNFVARHSRNNLHELSWGLKEIGLIKFTALRRNFARITSKIKAVIEGGYWKQEWKPE